MLNDIKLLSLDIWNTLLCPNADFKKSRTKIIADAYNVSDLDLLKKIIAEVDTELDKVSEMTGQDFTFTDRIKKIGQKLNLPELNSNQIRSLQTQINQAFIAMPPALIEQNLIEILKQIKMQGVSLALVSNTGFINGETMRIVLSQLGILNLIDFSLFSNEVGCAKPNIKIFQEIINLSQLPSHQIMHVGDSFDADYKGAESCEMMPVLYGDKYAAPRSIKALAELI